MAKTVVESINNLIKPHFIEGGGKFLHSESLLYLGKGVLAAWWCTCMFQHRGNGIFLQNHGGNLVSGEGVVAWPTWSPDLNPLNFFCVAYE